MPCQEHFIYTLATSIVMGKKPRSTCGKPTAIVKLVARNDFCTLNQYYLQRAVRGNFFVRCEE